MEILPVLVGCGMCAGGVWLIKTGSAIQAKRKAARSWPQAKGVILKIEKTGMGAKVINTGEYRKYFLNTEYSYTVNDRDYKGVRIVFGGDLIVAQEVDAFCEQYKEGHETNVYYNPDDPVECVLMLDRPGGKDKPEFFMGAVLIIMGLALAIANSGLV